ncbi:MAG: hypothetical protein KF856_13455 [Cyclobacteriaceae bacterium]|nr:hypothetical protein [Cyclobacteriaceae bacterium]
MRNDILKLVILVLVILQGCNNSKDSMKVNQLTSCVKIDTQILEANSFDYAEIINSYELPDSLVESWFKDDKSTKGHQNKLLAKKDTNFTWVLVASINDFNIDPINDSSSWIDMTQYLLIINSDCDVIDGIKVYEYIPGDMLEDSIVYNDKQILNIQRNWKLQKDTVVVEEKVLCLKTTKISKRQDMINTPTGKTLGTLIKVLQEEYVAINKVFYSTDSLGKFRVLFSEFGDPNKVSESEGEIIGELE